MWIFLFLQVTSSFLNMLKNVKIGSEDTFTFINNSYPWPMIGLPILKLLHNNLLTGMRYFFLVFFSTLSTLAAGADYYISSSGNDSNNGLTESAPWKSIAKVNLVFSNFQPGDRILFKRGDTFYGSLIIKKSGISGAPITIGAYGSGEQPVITGFTTLTSWINEGNGIYSSKVTSSAQTNMVTVNGAQVGMGRYPDSGTNLTYSTATTTSITDPGIGDATDWAGAEVVINKNDWTLDRCKISDHTGDIFTFSNFGSDQIPYSDRYFFIQNDLRCVTLLNEWYHDIVSSKFFIFGDPTSKTIKMATLNLLIDNTGFDYITVDGLNFQGSISHAVSCGYGSNNWIIQNCTFGFSGHSGIYFGGGTYGNINNNKISNCNSSGIYTLLDNSSITNNSIVNIGMIPGQSLLYHPVGIYLGGSDVFVQYNDIQYCSWSGIVPAMGATFTIKNNFINYSCLSLDDGGGIYLTGAAPDLRTVEGNIVLNCGIGGTDNERTRGIYLDGEASNVMVKDNSVAGSSVDGFANHGGINNSFIGNTSYNNAAGILFQEYTNLKKMTGLTIKGNNFFALTAEQYSLRFIAPDINIIDFGTADYNYYVRPVKDDDVFITYDESTGSKRRTLEEWKFFTGQDANSGKSPIKITDVSDARFEYNPTKDNKTINLDRPVTDVKGNRYENSITLLPYSSAILINLPDPLFPVVPVYINSVVEQITPDKIDMTYDLILGKIIPPASAFRVMIGSVQRTVSAVSISGTRVTLTLSSPVNDGEIVTVAYSQPSTNPLQSESTGLAESFTAKSVTNKVDSRRPRPVSLSVEAASPELLKMVFNMNLASLDPPASAFIVKVNSLPRSVSSVKVSGTEALLTLASPISSGDIITIAYTIPESNALRSVLNWYVLSFPAQPVTNLAEGLRPELISSSIENALPNLLKMTFSLDLAQSYIPLSSAFTVMVNSVQRSVNSVAILGKDVMLTLSGSVLAGDAVTVAYTVPSSGQLRSTGGWYVLTFLSQPVKNNVISVRPVPVSLSLESSSPNVLKITFSQTLSEYYIPPGSAFSVLVNSVPRTVNTVAISGSVVMLTLASPVMTGDNVIAAYTIPSINALRSISGWYVLSFGAQPVVNNVLNVRPVPVNSSVENSTPTALKIAFNLNLSSEYIPPASAFIVIVNSVQRTISSVTVSGAEVTLNLSLPVIYGDVISVGYTIPSINALRSASGWYVLSFEARSVTNNVLDVRPVLTGAVVEFTTPSLLDMTFSLTLSSAYVPPVTAFSVLVNSVRRTINSITLSGNRVQLSLTSPVVFGDVLTVAYTVSTNALRSIPGWYVLSFSQQPVLNKCLASTSMKARNFSSRDDIAVGNDIISLGSENNEPDHSSIFTGSINIYPNPATNYINLSFTEPTPENISVAIFDFTGKLCLENIINEGVSEINFPLHLKTGTYIMRISLGKLSLLTRKLIITY